MKRKTALILILLGATLLTACGGGGGGEASAPPAPPPPEPPPIKLPPPVVNPPPPPSTTVSEYDQHGGLGLVKAASMYREDSDGNPLGTGKGIVVAVVDTGATTGHPELQGQYVLTEGHDGATAHDRPGNFNPEDSGGHGTRVTGIIAAKKNDRGMHGVAYDAKIASYAFRFDTPDQTLATIIDRIRTNSNGIRIMNNSWGATKPIDEYTKGELQNVKPRTLAAMQRFVDADGVVLFAAGNEGWDSVLEQAGLPIHFPELEPGWLAVTSVGLDGKIWTKEQNGGSNACGSSADWCIAAPGGGNEHAGRRYIYTPSLTGYAYFAGTSAATPLVSGGLAALKSLFPNLSYHQIRERMLTTANKSGIYADTSIYGQGLLDLDAASKPVSGLMFALGAFDEGAVVTAEGTSLHLPAGAASRYLDGRDILVLDNYQRAPFRVPAASFARTGEGLLTMEDLNLKALERRWLGEDEQAGLALAGDDFEAWGLSDGRWFAARAQGPGAMEGLSHLVGRPLPHQQYRLGEDAHAVTLGASFAAGQLYMSMGGSTAANGETRDGTSTPGFGMFGWQPESVFAASFVPQGGSEAFGLSLASSLEKPMGLGGTGAFALGGDALSAGWHRSFAGGDRLRLGAGGRIAHLAPESGELVHFDSATVAQAGIDVSFDTGRNVTLDLQLQLERPVHAGAGSIRAASTIDEQGRIGYDDIALDAGDFLTLDRVDLGLGWTPKETVNVRAGVAAVRNGFGETDSIAGARLRVEF